jgi:hypothetical protein
MRASTEEVYNSIKKEHPNICRKKPTNKNFNAKRLVGISDLSQSESISMGNFFEYMFKELAKLCPKPNVKVHNRPLILSESVFSGEKKKNKQIDLLLEISGKLYYLESKLNCELDSEKFPHTLNKIKKVSKALENEYGCECLGKIVTPWYKYEEEMPDQYKNAKIMFASEYLNLIGFNYSEQEWYNHLHSLTKLRLKDIR